MKPKTESKRVGANKSNATHTHTASDMTVQRPDKLLQTQVHALNEALQRAAAQPNFEPYGELKPYTFVYNPDFTFTQNLERIFTLMRWACLDGMNASHRLRIQTELHRKVMEAVSHTAQGIVCLSRYT